MKSANILELVHGDAIETMRQLPDSCVELIFADLPYASTRCQWDIRLDMESLWIEFRRVLTERGTVVATAAGVFGVDMINAARDLFKYDAVWHKTRPSQFVQCKNRPMVDHENLLIFSKGTVQRADRSPNRMTYNPVGASQDGMRPHRASKSRALGVSTTKPLGKLYDAMKGFPRTVQAHANPYRPMHPTQKPESLLEWIIAAYSHPGDIVLDPTMGSGTAGVAAVRLGRSFVGIERDQGYFEHAEARILAARTGGYQREAANDAGAERIAS